MINTLDFPTGVVAPFASPYASLPAGWVKCDGSLYDGTLDAYAPLFEIISTNYGGSGSSFRVPNLGQRIIVCGSPGVWYGTTSVALTANQCGIPSHDHDVTETAHTHTVSGNTHHHTIRYVQIRLKNAETDTNNDFLQSFNSRTDGMTSASSGLDNTDTNDVLAGAPTSGGTTTGSSTATSAGAAHENRMPYVAMQYLIKL